MSLVGWLLHLNTDVRNVENGMSMRFKDELSGILESMPGHCSMFGWGGVV